MRAEGERRWPGWVSVVSLLVAIGALAASGWGAVYATALGQTQSLTQGLAACRDYRTEVLALTTDGLNPRQIEDLIALQDTTSFTSWLSEKESASTAADVLQAQCGSIREVVRLARVATQL